MDSHGSGPNIFRPAYEPDDRPAGFRSARARIGAALGTERVGLSQFEVPPGEAAYPYHWHSADEEVVIVLEGRPTLRAPEGEQQLERGEIVHFPTGPGGAHELRNDTDEPVRFLSVSSKGGIDAIWYPDAGRVCVAERVPRSDGMQLFFMERDAVGYWAGEPSRSSDPT